MQGAVCDAVADLLRACRNTADAAKAARPKGEFFDIKMMDPLKIIFLLSEKFMKYSGARAEKSVCARAAEGQAEGRGSFGTFLAAKKSTRIKKEGDNFLRELPYIKFDFDTDPDSDFDLDTQYKNIPS